MQLMLFFLASIVALYALSDAGLEQDNAVTWDEPDTFAMMDVAKNEDTAMTALDNLDPFDLLPKRGSLLGRRHRTSRRRSRRSRRRSRRSRRRSSRRRSRSRSRSRRRRSGGNPCKCEASECTCCKRIVFAKVCIELQYKDEKLDVIITAMGNSLLHQDVPLNDTQPICVKVVGQSVCAEMYDSKIEDGKIHSCIKLSKPLEFQLGCVDFGTEEQPIKAEVTFRTGELPESARHVRLLGADLIDDDGNDDRIMKLDVI